jgi:LPXTG-site transpeptidase (sortase) family protein
MKLYVPFIWVAVAAMCAGSTYATSWIDPVVANTTVTSKWVMTDPPTRFKPSDTSDWSYRKNAIPYSVDKSRDSYLVVPKIWMVVPISVPSDEELMDYRDKKSDLNQILRYFESGVFAHPSSANPGSGNYVIAGHSSNFTSNKWRYKTIFATLLAQSSTGDSIYIYVNRWGGEYGYYRYEISDLLQADPKDPKDLWVIDQTDDPTLTLYTCLPVGTVKFRGVVRAKLVETKLITPKYEQYLGALLGMYTKNTDTALARYKFYKTKLAKNIPVHTQLQYVNRESWSYFLSKLWAFLADNKISVK